MRLLPTSKREAPTVHHVRVSVDEADLLKRAAQLHTASYKIIQGTRLIRFLNSDYEEGCFEFLIEADKVHPTIAPGEFNVKVSHWEEPVDIL